MGRDSRQAIGRLLLDMAPRIMRLEANVLSQLRVPLTHRQYRILQRVGQGVSSPTAISRAASISLAAISESVDALWRRNLVTRSEDLEDRRASRLGLTPLGITTLDAAEESLERLAGVLSVGVVEDKADELCQGLGNIAENVRLQHADLGSRANR